LEPAEAEAIIAHHRERVTGLLMRVDELTGANRKLVEASRKLEERVAALSDWTAPS